jgi:hypothetical protein
MPVFEFYRSDLLALTENLVVAARLDKDDERPESGAEYMDILVPVQRVRVGYDVRGERRSRPGIGDLAS